MKNTEQTSLRRFILRFSPPYFAFRISILFWLFLSGISLSAQEVRISPSCSNFYAGQEAKFEINNAKPSDRIIWNISYSGRTIASSEKVSDAGGRSEFIVKFPDLNPGIVAEASLTATTSDSKTERKIFFFHFNPFTSSKKAASDMGIGLWTSSQSTTAKETLDKLEVPHVEIANFAEFTGSILLIDRIDFTAFPDIEKELTAICMRGARVIVINPQHGNFTLPASAREIHLADSKQIASFNKKLDNKFWGTTEPNSNTIKIRGDENSPAITVSEGKNGFSYFSAKFAKGELIICTWKIFEKATISPAPIYLLKEMVLGGEGNRQ